LVLLQDELFNTDPPAAPNPETPNQRAPPIGLTKGSEQFKARATVLAVCYFNIGVEQEFLGRPGCDKSFETAHEIAIVHLGPNHYITKQVAAAHTMAINRAQAAIGRPATRGMNNHQVSLVPLTADAGMMGSTGFGGDRNKEEMIDSPKTDGEEEDPWADLDSDNEEGPLQAGDGGFEEGLPGPGRDTLSQLIKILDQQDEDRIVIEDVADLFEQIRMWGPIKGCMPAERALDKLSQYHSEALDKKLCSEKPLPTEVIKAAYNQACKYVPSENMAMERAHAVIFNRVLEELEGAMGDGEPSKNRGARAPDRQALCSHVHQDAKMYLGEDHPLVLEANVVMLVQFKVDVKETKMCYQCDRKTYPCNTRYDIINEKTGERGAQECSRCSKTYVENCDNCQKVREPLFVSEASSGVPGGQLFCPECKTDHGVKRVWRKHCYSCNKDVFIKRRGKNEMKFNCYSCTGKMTQYCQDCKVDRIIIRYADNEPRCSGCKSTFQEVEIRHAAQELDKQRAQEKLAHVVKWIKAMWTGDFLNQVYMVWAKGSIDQLHKRKKVKKMVARVVHRKMSEGFQSWLAVCVALMKRRVDAMLRVDLMLSTSTREKYVYFFQVWQDAWVDFKNLTAGQKEARRLFDVFDADGNGSISLQELRFRMSDWGYDDETTETFALEVDLDGDGMVTWAEFLQGYDNLRQILGLAVVD